jgi:uncharacterized membrane protein YeaQ/YmgE (transglycosylase-associated protein family)
VGLLGWAIVGLLAGGLARRVVGAPKRGCLATMLIGVIGGVLGGALFQAAGGEGITDFSLWSIFVAFVGASLLLIVTGALARR